MNTPTPEPIICPSCNTQLGEIITVNSIPLFHAGGLWRMVRGFCPQCGKPFYWETSDEQVSVVIRLAQKVEINGK